MVDRFERAVVDRLGRFLIALSVALSVGVASSASSATEAHLRLLDRLDRPEDGYCVDILGVGDTLRTDLPLFAHNCKPRLTNDSAVVFTSEGQIRFPAVDRCITVAGVNSAALPGASILLRPCNGSVPFFETAALQRFTLGDDGRLVLTGSALCLAVGSQSATTYSASDRWRTLFVDECATAAPSRSRWEFVVPPN